MPAPAPATVTPATLRRRLASRLLKLFAEMEIFRGDPAPWREPMVAEAAERVAETLAQLHESEGSLT